jgi:hypothetical protein
MKLLRIDGDAFEFGFAATEKDLFLHLLGLYPVVPVAYHRLTRKKRIPNQEENQRLLDDAIQSQRLANQKKIIALVKTPGRFHDDKKSSRAVFQREELEWLLQVLNDVRIGNWIALGSPDASPGRPPQGDDKSFQHLMLMEVAGGFEMFFLGAVSGTLKPGVAES